MTLTSRELLLLRAVAESDPLKRGNFIDSWLKVAKLDGPRDWTNLPHHEENVLLPTVVSLLNESQLSRSPHKPVFEGIRRATVASNLALIGRVGKLAETMGDAVDIVFFKGAGLVAHGLPISRRRLNDVDFLVRRDDAATAIAALQDLGFTPTYSVTSKQILQRELRRRSGWNFTNEEGVRVDLHWSLFGLETEGERLTDELWNTRRFMPLGGRSVPVGELSFNIAYSSYHSRTRSLRDQRISTLADTLYFFRQEMVPALMRWAVDGFHRNWLRGDLQIVSEVLGWDAELETARGEDSLTPLAPWIEPPLSSKSNQKKVIIENLKIGSDTAFYRTSTFLPYLFLYWLPAKIQRFIDRPGLWARIPEENLNNVEQAKTIDCTNPREFDAVATIGWQWDPLDKCLWTDSHDSRLLFHHLKKRSLYFVRLSVHDIARNEPQESGLFSANPRGKIFSHGKHLKAYDLTQLDDNLTIECLGRSDYRGRLELSIRPKSPISRKGLNAIFAGWLRGLPVTRIEVSEATVQLVNSREVTR